MGLAGGGMITASWSGKRHSTRVLSNYLTASKSGEGGYTVSVLGQDEGFTVEYNPLPEGVPNGKATIT